MSCSLGLSSCGACVGVGGSVGSIGGVGATGVGVSFVGSLAGIGADDPNLDMTLLLWVLVARCMRDGSTCCVSWCFCSGDGAGELLCGECGAATLALMGCLGPPTGFWVVVRLSVMLRFCFW